MKNKTVFITGASSGFGKETAKIFAENEWNVVATMRNTSTEHELQQKKNVTVLQLDVTQKDTIENAVRKAVEQFGQIDVLINNAGYGAMGIFEEASDDEIYDQFNVNVFGSMRVTRAVLPYMRNNRRGTIINLSSVAGSIAFSYYSLYNASKFAVNGWSEALFYELKEYNIKVKVISPGPFKSNFFKAFKLIQGNKKSELDNKRMQFDQSTKVIANNNNAKWKQGEPLEVAKVIYTAANDQKNQFIYPIGTLGPISVKFALIIKKLLPEKAFSFLMQQVNNNQNIKAPQ